jgi:hypothetical protein
VVANVLEFVIDFVGGAVVPIVAAWIVRWIRRRE